jgi:hypothetical protein
MTTVREQLIAKLDNLSDEQVAAVLHYVEAMQTTSLPEDYDEAVLHYIKVMNTTSLPANYDEANDPAIGFLVANPELASRSDEIL